MEIARITFLFKSTFEIKDGLMGFRSTNPRQKGNVAAQLDRRSSLESQRKHHRKHEKTWQKCPKGSE